MERSDEEEAQKVAAVSPANAAPDPWAMVIVDFNADAASGAVEGPRRSEKLTGIAIRKLIVLIFFSDRLLIPARASRSMNIFEFPHVVELGGIVALSDALLSQASLQFFARLVLYRVVKAGFCLHFRLVAYFRVGCKAGDDARVARGDRVKGI